MMYLASTSGIVEDSLIIHWIAKYPQIMYMRFEGSFKHFEGHNRMPHWI